MMQIGVVGKPNVGKSTFFTSSTKAPAEIANYPFTTIKPNVGVGFVHKPCPHVDLKTVCNPKNAECHDGVRFIPIQMLDVAGLVPGAHEGKGLGNQFLNDLSQASALIHIVDASGGTDAEGRPVKPGDHDPLEDVAFLEREIHYWIAGILGKGWEKISRKIDLTDQKVEKAVAEQLAGLGVKDKDVLFAMRDLEMPEKVAKWSEEDLVRLSARIQRLSKPIIIAANKADQASKDNLNRLESLENYIVIPTSAEYELALTRAAGAGLVTYKPGDTSFEIAQPEKLNPKQREALERIEATVDELGGTGVQRCLEEAAFNLLQLIAVYPVEDENKYTDKEGRVLPDAHLIPKGSNALDLAFKVHTDLGNNFIRAIDARTRRVVGRDHVLRDGDVVTIVSKV